MYYFTLNQAYVFSFCVYGGAAIGLIYDIFRLIRRIVHAGRFFTLSLDFLFWLCALFISLLILFLSNGVRLRLFPFLGYGLGFLIYRIGISSVFWWIVSFLQNKLKKAFQKKSYPLK